MTDTLLLVDGSSYLYRAYHALPDLRSPQHEPTGAIHGIIAMLRRLREQYPAHLGACVFDAKGPTFRHELYPDYKGHRPPMPEDLVRQIVPIHEVVRLFGWPVLEVPGIEADDVIGTLSRLGAQAGYRVVISTGDKDLAQLVNDRVTLVNTMSNETLDPAGVQAKFGVPPERIVDYLTLVGDAVDNVPGVEKVGPKTAAKWIKEYDTLDGVLAAAPAMSGATGENLRKALDWLPTARRLITVEVASDLSAHVPGWPQLQSLQLREADAQGLLTFYTHYGFKTWKAELEKQQGGAVHAADAPPSGQAAATPDPAAASGIEPTYETVLSREGLQAWIERVQSGALIALDTETTSLDPMQARLVGLSLSDAAGQAAYIPLAHDYAGAPAQLPLDEVIERLRPWLEDERYPKLGQHIKYDTHVLANHGIDVRGYVHDTLLQSYVLEAHKPHSLESLAQRHLGVSGLSYEDVCGKGAAQIGFSQVALERAAQYSCEDSDLTLRVHQTLWPRLEAESRLREVYQRIEMPVSRILQRMERHGVLIDADKLAAQSRELAERMSQLEQEAHRLAGQPFNLSSPKQIGEILFGKLELPVVKKTPSGTPSTDEEVLEKLAQDYPLPARILEYRSLAKLKGTYTDKLPQMIHPRTGRVHTNYGQAVAVTGRLASNDPNLQNIPVRTAEGRRIREAFIAPPGHVLVSADYSQIELRIMAHLSQDTGLLRAFHEHQDVHRATAAEVFGVSPQEVSSEQRRYAKVINFGLIYGMSSFGLASNLGIERKAADAYIERYFLRYPGVKRYMEATRAQAKEHGYVETVFGRRLWLPEINSGNGPRRGAAERAAINAPMQGTAADLIKLAMIAVQGALDQEARRSRMIMQVHDELVLEVPQDELDWAREALPRLMAGVASLDVPLEAEVGVGSNWDEAH